MSQTPLPPTVWIILGPIAVLAVVSIVFMLFARGPKPPDAAWRGMFYSNRSDPAVWVPKRYGIGYTLNFGNPWSWLVIVIIFAAVAVPLIFSLTVMRQFHK